MKKRVKCSECEKMAYENWPSHYRRMAAKNVEGFVCKNCKSQIRQSWKKFDTSLPKFKGVPSASVLQRKLKVTHAKAYAIQSFLQSGMKY